MFVAVLGRPTSEDYLTGYANLHKRDHTGAAAPVGPALAAAAFASSAAATTGLTFFPSLYRGRGGGARLRRPSLERTRTTGGVVVSVRSDLSRADLLWAWMAHETQYTTLMYSFGTVYSRISRLATSFEPTLC
jgi:hypothetical protein